MLTVYCGSDRAAAQTCEVSLRMHSAHTPSACATARTPWRTADGVSSKWWFRPATNAGVWKGLTLSSRCLVWSLLSVAMRSTSRMGCESPSTPILASPTSAWHSPRACTASASSRTQSCPPSCLRFCGCASIDLAYGRVHGRKKHCIGLSSSVRKAFEWVNRSIKDAIHHPCTWTPFLYAGSTQADSFAPRSSSGPACSPRTAGLWSSTG